MANDAASTGNDAADASVADAPNASNGRTFWFVLALLVVLPALGGGWLAYSQYGWLNQTATTLNGGKAAGGAAPIEYGAITELDNLIVNPAGSRGERYLAVSIGFEAADQAVLTELEEHEVVVRDALLRRLSAYSIDELSTVARRDSLKSELLGAVNERLQDGVIDRIYFTRYVLQ